MFICREMGMNAKSTLYEKVALHIAEQRAETWIMTVAEKERLNVMKMRCLRSTCVIVRMDELRNEDLGRSTNGTEEKVG